MRIGAEHIVGPPLPVSSPLLGHLHHLPDGGALAQPQPLAAGGPMLACDLEELFDLVLVKAQFPLVVAAEDFQLQESMLSGLDLFHLPRDLPDYGSIRPRVAILSLKADGRNPPQDGVEFDQEGSIAEVGDDELA